MNKFNFQYSLKNIPIPPRHLYEKEIIHKFNVGFNRLNWNHYWKCKDKKDSTNESTSFGFKSNRVPYYKNYYKLDPFKKDLVKLIASIKYRPHSNAFQKTLKEDCSKIKQSNDVIVSADKTSNLYGMPVETYKSHLKNNITKDYKKSNMNKVKETNKEAAQIATRFKVEEKAEILSDSPCFITIKDHKPNFPGHIECRLINPSKTEIGKISKNILENINKTVKSKTGLNQWQNTTQALDWFKGLKNKHQLTFFQFDIASFYPSITNELLQKAIRFAKQFTQITDDDINIILHARKTFLFSSNEAWVKTNNEDFDVPMGGFDSAEISELVGLFILNSLEEFLPKTHIGLYRDDGLAVTNLPGPGVERLKKQIIQFFKSNKLQITTNANIKIVNFLDVTLNLNSGCFKPFRKETNPPRYINTKSCHPPNIIKQLPLMIEKRVTDLSSNETLFNEEKDLYNTALKTAGYKYNIKYKKQEQNTTNRAEKTRKRKIIWFNPPFNAAVKTNIAKEFLKLIDKHFPAGSELHKYYNRNTIKISYSTMPNMQSIISTHNKRILGDSKKPTIEGCNCRQPQSCPLDGKCKTKDMVYKATVTLDPDQSQHHYIGLASTTFKKRWSTHKSSFVSDKASTKLSDFIKRQKGKKTSFKIDWSIKTLANSYNQNSKKCNLCLTESFEIMKAFKSNSNTLNTRNEIFQKCTHREKFLLFKNK